MSKINACYLGELEMNRWIQSRINEVQQHPAWQGKMEDIEAEQLLQSQEILTYLLRKDQEDFVYYISFVKPDFSVKHQRFTLEYDPKGWYYRNGGGDGPTAIVAHTVEELIPQMMHCPLEECKYLKLSR